MPYRNWLSLLAIGLPVLLGCFDIMAVGLGINNIGQSFQCPISTVQWIMSLFMICNAAFTITTGKLCDKYGPKKIFILGYSLFNICSLLNILSPSIYFLIISRGLQGISTCMLLISSTSLIHLSFPKEQHIKIFSIWSFFVGAGTALGPILGGTLIYHYGWKSIFVINLFPMIINYLLIKFYLKTPEIKPTVVNIKALPLVINITLLVGVAIFLMELPALKFMPILVLTPLIIALCGYYIRVNFEKWKIYLENKQFLSGALAGIVSYFSLYAWLLVTPLYLISIHKISIMATGIVMLPYYIAFTVGPLVLGQVSVKLSKKFLLILGLSLNTLSMISMMAVTPSIVLLAISYFIFGIGTSFINISATTLALDKIPKENSGIASAILYTIRWFAGAAGICLATITWQHTHTFFGVIVLAIFIGFLSIGFVKVNVINTA